jgi:ferredoxin-NADP reductase
MTLEKTLRVEGLRWYSEGVFELVLERAGIVFTPGDCLALFTGDGRASRPYSLASGQDDPRLRFIIRRMPGGTVSGWLSRLVPGDRVRVSPPFGWFRPGGDDPEAPFVFVATGTGISPFLAWLRSRPDRIPDQCLYGVRTLADAAEWDWIRAHCPLRLALSRETVPGHHQGRVTDLLAAMPWSPRHHYYLCGLDAMLDEVTRFLEARGAPITSIHRECFFNAEYASPLPGKSGSPGGVGTPG